MGNTCSGPTKTGKAGFLQSVSAAVWRPRGAKAGYPAIADGSDADCSRKPPPDSAASPTNSTTPSTADSPGAQHSLPEQITVKSEPQPPPEHETPATTATGNADGPDKTKKPIQVKRVNSAGLQLESVLGRKTGNIKELYGLGRKLGQGQFGTTFLCVRRRPDRSSPASRLICSVLSSHTSYGTIQNSSAA